jgi:hypothetical protein
MLEGKIDKLVQVGLEAYKDDLDMEAIHQWKIRALELLVDQLGPSHYYTRYFQDHIRKAENQNLLTGSGILSAAKEEIARRKMLVVRELRGASGRQDTVGPRPVRSAASKT